MFDTTAIATEGIGNYNTLQMATLGYNVYIDVYIEPETPPITTPAVGGGGFYGFKSTHNIIKIIVHFMGQEDEYLFRVPINVTTEVQTELIKLFMEQVNVKCDLCNINRIDESNIKIYTKFEGKK